MRRERPNFHPAAMRFAGINSMRVNVMSTGRPASHATLATHWGERSKRSVSSPRRRSLQSQRRHHRLELCQGNRQLDAPPISLVTRRYRLNFPKAARAGDLIPQRKADSSLIGPTLRWKQATPSPFTAVLVPAAVVKGYFYLFGGFTDDLNASNRVDVYDPATDTWNRKKDMPVGLTHLNAVVDGDHIWLAGGFKGKHPGPLTDEVWKYDIASDSWAPGPRLPQPRAGGGLAVLEHRLHYFGGYLADREKNTGDHWSLAIEEGKDWQRNRTCPTHEAIWPRLSSKTRFTR